MASAGEGADDFAVYLQVLVVAFVLCAWGIGSCSADDWDSAFPVVGILSWAVWFVDSSRNKKRLSIVCIVYRSEAHFCMGMLFLPLKLNRHNDP